HGSLHAAVRFTAHRDAPESCPPTGRSVRSPPAVYQTESPPRTYRASNEQLAQEYVFARVVSRARAPRRWSSSSASSSSRSSPLRCSVRRHPSDQGETAGGGATAARGRHSCRRRRQPPRGLRALRRVHHCVVLVAHEE